MFIPEVGEFFHVYTAEWGLLKSTVFECKRVEDGPFGVVVADYAAGAVPSIPTPCTFNRSIVSFWPVQPGYRQHLLGQPQPRDLKAAPEFTQDLKNRLVKYG